MKIFDITRKLDTVAPQQLYLRIIETFEEVLENKSITVYSVNSRSASRAFSWVQKDPHMANPMVIRVPPS